MRPLGKGWIVTCGPTDNNPARPCGRSLPTSASSASRPPTRPRPACTSGTLSATPACRTSGSLFNEFPNPVTTDLTFLPGVHPASLTDLLTGATSTITRAEGGDSVPGIALHPWQTVMYVSPRADVAASPLEWLNFSAAGGRARRSRRPSGCRAAKEMQRFTLDLTDGWAYKRIDGMTDDQAAALAQPATDDHAWERRTWTSGSTPAPQSRSGSCCAARSPCPPTGMPGRFCSATRFRAALLSPEARMFRGRQADL